MIAPFRPRLCLLVAVIFLGLVSLGTSIGPPVIAPWTGAPAVGIYPPEFTCAHGPCHSAFSLNKDGLLEILGVPPEFQPGAVYPLTVKLTSLQTESFPDRSWGFELVALSGEDGTSTGSFMTETLRIGQKNTPDWGDRVYISHDDDTNQTGVSSPVSWTFDWEAPQGVGSVFFYAAGNAGNGDFTTGGDYIYTASSTTLVASTPVQHVTWGGIKKGNYGSH